MSSENERHVEALTAKTEADRALADFWRAYVEAGRGGFSYVAGNPRHAIRAFRAIRQLPVINAGAQSDTPGGQEVRRVLDQKGPLGLPARWWGSAVLPVLDNPGDFLKSPAAKRLRYNLRRANAEGITSSPVLPPERPGLLELANDQERNHPDETYRVTNPRNEDLSGHDLWMVAKDNAGVPLHLAVVATDGPFAVLRYFRTLGYGQQHSLSRYFAHHAVVEALAAEQVRWLVDTDPPAAQTNGVRLFQRIVGFRHMYIRRASPTSALG